MKREKLAGMGVLCTALLLSGCQPTTDTAIVTPKSAIAGAKMVDEATVGNVPEQVQVPETYAMECATDNGEVKIIVDAKVTVPQVDGIRLKKVETRVFNQGDMDNLQENLLQGNALERRGYTEKQEKENIRWTQDEVSRIIELEEEYGAERYLEAEKYGWDASYIDAQINWWYERMDTAPESFPVKEASTKIFYDKYAAEQFFTSQDSYAPNSNIVWGGTVMDGQIYNFFLNNNWYSESKSVIASLVKGYYYWNYGEWDLYTSDAEYYMDNYDAEEMYAALQQTDGTVTGAYDASQKTDGTVTEEAYAASQKTDGAVMGEAYDASQQAYETEAEEQSRSQAICLDMMKKEEEWSLKTPLEELKAKGDALAEALGLEEMELAGYEKCGTYDGYIDIPMSAVNLIYTPVVDGIPVTYTDYRFMYDNETQDYSEIFQVAYDDDGLVQVKWQNPAEIYDMSDEYVFLLPFSDILKTFQEQAPELHRMESDMETIYKIIYITDIKLGYMWVPDESTEMEGMMIPVWDFIGKRSLNWQGNEEKEINSSWDVFTSPYQSFLTVNAMDGSIVEGALRSY